MVDFNIVPRLWNINKWDLVPYLFTFGFCFYSLETGLLVGIATSLLFIIYPAVVPSVDVTSRQMTVIAVKDGLFYPGVSRIIDKIEETFTRPDPPTVVLLDMGGVNHIDYTVIRELSQVLSEQKQILPEMDIFVTNAPPHIQEALERANLADIVRSRQSIRETIEDTESLLRD